MLPQPSADPCAELLALDASVQREAYVLDAEAYTLGRSAMCQIVVQQSLVSRIHATIERHGPRYLLRDMGSANGTFVNGQRLREHHILQGDDVIGLGSPAPLLRFLDPDPTFMPAQRLHYDERTLTFSLGNRQLDLTPAQFRLLSHLYQHLGQVCSRESCAQAIWQRDYEPGLDAGALDQALTSLRGALRQVDPTVDLIKTRRGLGYVLEL